MKIQHKLQTTSKQLIHIEELNIREVVREKYGQAAGAAAMDVHEQFRDAWVGPFAALRDDNVFGIVGCANIFVVLDEIVPR